MPKKIPVHIVLLEGRKRRLMAAMAYYADLFDLNRKPVRDAPAIGKPYGKTPTTR
ncbi:hypothetical protein [Mitsuaria sp. GD03876]|uniref:hypothetical protein n=1 Tax=Mitsuaria sp. GD03876 TaxID=2975399 RepID=UPI00244728BF|nr:hypothetical protein [Mitsuaria sp. GD03876]MDH0866779.1 hypothetical protein [Mitsuaria sp. GD03876]